MGFHDLEEIKQEMILQSGYTAVHREDGEFQYFLPDSFLEGFHGADEDKNEVVTKDEFMKFYKHKDSEKDFHAADVDGDGTHTLNEMAKRIFESEDFKKLLKEADVDGDGKVSDSEFLAHLLLHQGGS